MTGNLSAPVTVVEFGDFECPACGREEPVVQQILAKYGKRIRFVFRQFPLIHTHLFSERMAEASECAAEQGKFWQGMHEIYSHQTDLTEEALKRDANDIGLDLDKFNKCMATSAEAAQVKRDREDGQALGVNSTPTFFVGRNAVADVPDFDEFSRLIDQELLAAGAGSPAASARSAAPGLPTTEASTESKNSAKRTNASQKTAPAPAASESTPSSFGLLGSASVGALTSFQSGMACSEDEAAKKQPTLINTSQLRELLAGNSKPMFVDVRPAKEYAAGKISGAINIPADDVPKRWDTLPKDRTIVFYESGKSSGDICAAGRAAGRILLEHGYAFDQVKVYQDGLAGWEKSGLEMGR
jgi:rhodanese-related sulfurtransferase/predicted DsbA family dithiol-disulfide isomerase